MERALELTANGDMLRLVETEIEVEGDVIEIGCRIEVGVTEEDVQTFTMTCEEISAFISVLSTFQDYLKTKQES